MINSELDINTHHNTLTWWRAVSPSSFVESGETPNISRRRTSSISFLAADSKSMTEETKCTLYPWDPLEGLFNFGLLAAAVFPFWLDEVVFLEGIIDEDVEVLLFLVDLPSLLWYSFSFWFHFLSCWSRRFRANLRRSYYQRSQIDVSKRNRLEPFALVVC